MTADVNSNATKGEIIMTRGEKVCAFIEQYCKIPEGAEVGQPIKLINQLKSPNTGPFVLATNLTPVSELPTAAIASIAKDAVSSSGHSVIVRAVLSPVLIKRRFRPRRFSGLAGF